MAEAELFTAEDETDLTAPPAEDATSTEIETETKPPEEPVTTEETTETSETETETTAEPSTTVPLPEHLTERKRRQALEGQLAAERQKMETLGNRLDELTQRLTPAPPDAPDFEEDPQAHNKHQIDGLTEAVRGIDERLKAEADERVQITTYQNLQNFVATSESTFREAHPDYDGALSHLRSQRDAEYRAMGMTDRAQINELIVRDSIGMAQQAQAQGLDPAEVIYSLATVRGWQPPAVGTDGAGAGGPSSPAQAPQASGEAAAKLEAVAKGQATSKSLSAMGGQASMPLTLETLAEMDEDDFGKIDDAQWRKLMGAT